MTTPPGRTEQARADSTNPAKCETQGKRCLTESTARGPQPTPGLPPPGPAEHALHGTSRGPVPRTRPGAGDAAPMLYAPRPARAATPPSTRTSPLGLHRSHCRVRRLGHATLGPHPWGQTTRPATQRWAADPVNVSRTAEPEAAADSTGTTTQQPDFISTDYGPAPGDSGQTKLRDSDQEEIHFMKPKNRTLDGPANR
jgi:hypothetical protein